MKPAFLIAALAAFAALAQSKDGGTSDGGSGKDAGPQASWPWLDGSTVQLSGSIQLTFLPDGGVYGTACGVAQMRLSDGGSYSTGLANCASAATNPGTEQGDLLKALKAANGL